MKIDFHLFMISADVISNYSNFQDPFEWLETQVWEISHEFIPYDGVNKCVNLYRFYSKQLFQVSREMWFHGNI